MRLLPSRNGWFLTTHGITRGKFCHCWFPYSNLCRGLAVLTPACFVADTFEGRRSPTASTVQESASPRVASRAPSFGEFLKGVAVAAIQAGKDGHGLRELRAVRRDAVAIWRLEDYGVAIAGPKMREDFLREDDADGLPTLRAWSSNSWLKERDHGCYNVKPTSLAVPCQGATPDVGTFDHHRPHSISEAALSQPGRRPAQRRRQTPSINQPTRSTRRCAPVTTDTNRRSDGPGRRRKPFSRRGKLRLFQQHLRVAAALFVGPETSLGQNLLRGFLEAATLLKKPKFCVERGRAGWWRRALSRRFRQNRPSSSDARLL